MPYEFLAKNGLISQGNITATGSLAVTQNISASATGSFGIVGIGTTSPAQKLDVRGYIVSDVNSNAAESGFYLGNSGHGLRRPSASNDVYLYTTSGTLYLGTTGDSSQQITLLNGGNVGIGTTSTTAKLDVVSSPTAIGTIIRVRDTVTLGTGSFAGIHFTSNPGTDYTIGKLTTAAGAGLLQIRDQSGNQFVTVNSSGDVGIGTSSPLAKLHVSSSVAIANFDWTSLFAAPTVGLLVANNSGSAAIRIATLDSNSTHDPYLNFLTSGGQNWSVGVDNSDSDKLKISMAAGFATNEFLTIDNSGNVGIGTTSPNAKLDLYNGSDLGSGANGIRVQRPGAYGQYGYLEYLVSSDSTILGSVYTGGGASSFGRIFFRQHSSTTSRDAMVINTDGNVGIGTTSPAAKLDVSGSSNATILNLYRNVNSATTPLLYGIEAGGSPGKTNIALFERLNNLIPANVSASSAGIRIREHSANYALSIEDHSNNSYLVIKGGGNVGIGTTNPAFLLDVSGSSRFGFTSTNTHQFTGSVSLNGSLLTNANITASNISASGTGSFGAVGIGTSNVDAKLTILGTSTQGTAYNAINLNNSDRGGASIGFKNFTDASVITLASVNVISEDAGSGNYNDGVFTINTAEDTTNLERFRITSRGHVGIGTTSPDIFGRSYNRILGISGSSVGIQLNSNTGTYLDLGINGTRIGGLFASSIAYEVGTPGNFPMHFYTSGSYKMSVLVNGNVGIGTTTPNSKLEVAGTAGTAIISVNNTTAGRSGSFGIDSAGVYIRNSNDGDYFDLENASGTSRFRLVYDNNTFLNTTYTSVGSLTSSGSKLSVFGNLSVGSSYGSTAAPSNGAIFQGGVGIGTTNPYYAFDVYTNSTAGALMSIRASGSANARIYFDAANGDLTGGDYCYIGQESGSLNFVINTDVNSGNIHIQPRFGSATDGRLIVSGSSQFGRSSTSNHQFTGSVNINGGLTLTNLTASNISASGTSSFGYVGIGTTSPAYKLDLQSTSSTARLGNAIVGAWPVNTTFALFGHNNLDHSTSATNYALIQWNDGTTYLNASSGKNINFRINNSDKMILNSSGQFGIGTTSPITGYLDVRSNQTKSVAGPTSIAFFGSGDGGSPLGLVLNHESSSGVKMVGLVGTEYGSSGNNIKINETLHVQYSGNVGIGAINPNSKLTIYGSPSLDNTFTYLMNLLNTDSTITAGMGSGISFGSNITSGGGTNIAHLCGIIGIKENATSGNYAGALTFWTRINGAASAERLRIDSSGSVGIGTTSPSYKLDVNGDIRAMSGSTIRLQTSAGQERGTFQATDTTGAGGAGLAIATSGGEEIAFKDSTDVNMVIKGTGRVGIGTITPAEMLHISSSNNTQLRLESANDTAVQFVGPDTHSYALGLDLSDSSKFKISYNASRTPPGLGTNDRLVIDTSGNVGIGTAVPAAKLHVIGDISGSGQVRAASFFTTGAAGSSYFENLNIGTGIYIEGGANEGIYFGDSNRWIIDTCNAAHNDNADGELHFRDYTNSVTRMLIQYSTGNVGIGTTVPTARLHVTGSTGGVFEVDTSGSATTFYVSASGNVGIGSASPVYKLDVAGGDVNFATGTILRFGTVAVLNESSNANDIYANIRVIRNLSSVNQDGMYIGYGNSGGTAGHLRFYANNLTERMRIDASNGNVGIGITNPAAKLSVTGSGTGQMLAGDAGFGVGNYTGISVNGTLNTSAYNILSSPTDTNLYINRPSGNTIYFRENNQDQMVLLTGGNLGIGTSSPSAKVQISGSANSVLLNVKSPISGNIVYVTGSGAVGINTTTPAYTLQVNGSFAATTKSFVIDHPTKPDKKLVYGSLESPYHGIRLTGRDTLVDGKCVVELPDYISKLIMPETVNIQLTGIKCNKTLYVDDINIKENNFTVAYDKGVFESYKDYDFFWDFTAVRADVPELQTEM